MTDPATGRTIFHTECVFACDQCQRLSVAAYVGSETASDMSTPSLNAFFSTYQPTEWAPKYVEGQSFPDVPPHISDAAGEAHKGASAGNFMSAILMARTVIEATAKDKGITEGSLKRKIELMVAGHLIRPHIQEVADEVRHFGNDMAHGDIAVPVTEADTDQVLGLMDEILNEVYQGPARVAAVKRRRIERQES